MWFAVMSLTPKFPTGAHLNGVARETAQRHCLGMWVTFSMWAIVVLIGRGRCCFDWPQATHTKLLDFARAPLRGGWQVCGTRSRVLLKEAQGHWSSAPMCFQVPGSQVPETQALEAQGRARARVRYARQGPGCGILRSVPSPRGPAPRGFCDSVGFALIRTRGTAIF